MKQCLTCHRTPEETPFRIVSKNGRLNSYCKECESDYKKKWYQDNKNGERVKRKMRYGKDKEAYIKRARKSALLRQYGLTLDDYNQMFDDQEGCCAICGIHQSELTKALVVDHNHETGKVRKLLCDNCNKALGLFKDSPDILFRAAEYLEQEF